MNKRINQEKRIRCTNWDDENVVSLASNGKNHSIVRKVITKDVKSLDAGDLIYDAIRLLKQGYEVRLNDNGGDAALRLYPCVDKEMKSMYISAQTMGDFRHSLKGKKIAFTRGGEDISTEEAFDFAKKCKKRGDEVTPDKMATCPKCGKHFRVGKRVCSDECGD